MWQLGELAVPQGSVCSFVADYRGTTFGEDGGSASLFPWVAIIRLLYAAVLLKRRPEEVYVPPQHNSGSQSTVALR